MLATAGVVLLAACRPSRPEAPPATAQTLQRPQLPTGVNLDPAGRTSGVGNMPLSMVMSPDGRSVALLLNGWREQGVQIVDRASGRVRQTLAQPAAFLGLAFAPDGRTLYASGGNQDVIYRYAWTDTIAVLRDSIALSRQGAAGSGTRYPAGLALSPDGATLYVAENLDDSLAVVDVETGRVRQRLSTGRYPYTVVVSGDGEVYVSAWGGTTVSAYSPGRHGTLTSRGAIAVGRHPSSLLLAPNAHRLFVTLGSMDQVIVVDLERRQVVATLSDPPPAGPAEGSTPNALALSPDGTRLYVAEADANAVSLFNLSAGTSGIATATGSDSLAGRIPVAWYPVALEATRDSLWVLCGKGRTTAPNPTGPRPGVELQDKRAYTLGQTDGALAVVALPQSTDELAALSARVVRANGWDRPRPDHAYPPFQHVIYVVKENRTYDQVLADLPQGDGDTTLLFFPRPVAPNHHALAERFGLYDRFFVNADVSADGHNWSMAGYATDYTIKTTPSNYSGRGRSYDYEGTNRDSLVDEDDDVAAPAHGYLWNLALSRGLSVRDYGEFAVRDASGDAKTIAAKATMRQYTSPEYAPFDMDVSDQRRMDAWLAEFDGFVKSGKMPALEIVHLPNDHTAGAKAGKPTPRAYMADNDLALGRMIEALSKSPFWATTVVFVLEDDAQNGADHVDSHRSPLLLISPYNHGGVIHRFANTTDVLLTIEQILQLGSLSHFDYYGRALREVFASDADLRPYSAITPEQPLNETSPVTGRGARASARLDFRTPDAADDYRFGEIVWHAVKGDSVPYPPARRIPALDVVRSH